jgi:hypothetical protein
MKSLALTLCLLLSSCATLEGWLSSGEKPTYDPETYGTGALIEVLLEPKRSEADAMLAARTLAGRSMGKPDGMALMRAVRIQPYEQVRLEVLNTIGTHQLSYLYPHLMSYVLEAEEPQTAVRALDAAASILKQDDPLYEDLSRLLLTAQKPEIRARAGMQLTKRFPYEAEPELIKSLETETSASVAAMLTEYLSQKGTKASLPVLETVSNDINRVYVEDSFLGKTFTADAVRGGAVKGVQRLRGDRSR